MLGGARRVARVLAPLVPPPDARAAILAGCRGHVSSLKLSSETPIRDRRELVYGP